MQEFAFDEAAMRNLPKQEGMEAGLPCSGASVSGRARRGTKLAEDHPHVGHLVVAALMILAKANPAFILFENVIPYSSSASASILRNQLRDLGYNTHETVLRGKDFNALEDRNRWCMVAVTQGMHFDWDMLVKPEKKAFTFSDVMDDIPDDSPLWSEMRGLKEKEKRDLANGKNFRMNVIGPESEKVGTMGKGYARVRSTEPKVRHPSDPNLLRQATVNEHAKVMQWPPSVVAGLSKTIAHEVLGQGTQREPFEAAAYLLGDAILDYAHDGNFSARDLVQLVADNIGETASMVVTEIRAPLAGVIYEGRITVNDIGMVIQDVGNGVGILHKASAMAGDIKLGESLKIQYPKVTALPVVTHLDRPAPAVTPELVEAQADAAREELHQRQIEQFQMFPPTAAEAEQEERVRPRFGPRM
jgi:DNA (cytosine-5)-methyltransferase 1